MATITGVLITPLSGPRVVEFEDTLEELQRLVEGYVDGYFGMTSRAPVTMFVNDEGLIRGLRINERATQFARAILDVPWTVAGHVLIVGPVDNDGNNTNVRPDVLKHFNLEA